MGHEHGHSHGHGAVRDARALKIALTLILAFMSVEVVVGVVASSLALLSDAAHMLTDAAALALSLLALRIARRPARGAMTYGFGRVEILSAQANGITLLLLGAWITYEAIRRLFDPPAVEGGLVLIVAVVGIFVNLAATWVLARANRESLNVEGSFQHILTDLYAFIATAIAGAVILLTGFERADPLASLLVAGSMFLAGTSLVKASARVFLEAAPEGFDPQQIGMALARHDGVVEVHDLHVWEVTSGFPALSAHVVARAGLDLRALRLELATMLDEQFELHHATLQLDHEQGPLQIAPLGGEPGAGGDASQPAEGVSATSPSASRAPEK
ncbi:cation diffusion facilitator family transporter [Conexibacter stalactiti]|uniref:Cation diffusion facilitator family transporter n=1 Tax=Conexibacter stalactiti TaxID=1940611 RepID=A0ABU4HMB1_9ACTN|nr:cation diffusion facilitator family transporter [Conexibacter stalactiti]MDW5594402.1 cation diffusion facilitator family transporter [Conexibacter stalactiti]MEC5035044.1 cation diffusion facilitator family transporter [Conexibacter stalactiti]